MVSDVTSEIDKLGKDFEKIAEFVEVKTETVECGCCGLHEECTHEYILQVKHSYFGKWLCGLCSEAVKDKLNIKHPSDNITVMPMEEALTTHKTFCQESRINPKLSFTSTMREIAKRSSENRKKNQDFSKIARSSSCVPRFSLSK